MILDPGTPLRVSLATCKDVLPVARIAMAGGVAQLEWSPEIRERDWAIDPLYPPVAGLVAAPGLAFYGLHPFLADSLPDGWGMRLMKRRLAARDIRIEKLDGLDRLALVGRRGRGALVYEPDALPEERSEALDLDALAAEADQIWLGADDGALADTLARLGGGSGGARPKVHIAYLADGRLCVGDSPDETLALAEQWIVKFRSPEDAVDIGPVEQAYAELARNAGIDMSASRLVPAAKGPGYFSTQRFDRPAPGQRLHVVSLAGALRTDWNTPTIGYHQFFQATRAITRHQGDVEQAYRRMVFNILSSNRDDHAGQHAYLMDNAGQWRLSPAYDLTFSQGPRGEHYLDVDGEGRRPTRAHATTLAQKHGIALPLANKIIDEVRASLSSWTDIAEETGVTASAKEIQTRLTEIDLDFRP